MKIKYPIILKIALLGILVTGLALGVLLVISSVNRTEENKASLLNNIDNTLLSIQQDYELKDTKEDLGNALDVVKNYINSIRSDVPELDSTSEADYASFEEYKSFIKSSFPWIYPDPNVPPIGSSLPKQVFKSNYRNISLMLKNACLTSGGKYAYIAYYDPDSEFQDLIFINDSRLDESDTTTDYYHLPGSHINQKVPYLSEGVGEIELDGKITHYIVIDESNESPNKSYLFVEYDFNSIIEKNNSYLINNLIIVSITLISSIIIYMLFAYIFIIRNLKKLTMATNNISNDLKNKKIIEQEKIVLKSHDELGMLASSFGIMQDEIVNYTNIIKQEAKENERRIAELDVASKIQLSTLPSNSYDDNIINIKAFIQPAKIVGGDFYDYFYNKDDFIFVVADVSGKGIPASLFMMKAKVLIKSKVLSGHSLEDAIKEVNIELNNNNTESLFVTAFIGAYNHKKNELRFINAGHEKPYIIHNGKLIKLEGDSNYVLGIVDDVDFIEEKIAFDNGDIFFGFTDGLNESINNSKEEFGYNRIEDILSNSNIKSLEELIDLFYQKHIEFIQNEEQFDDITMLSFKANDNSLHLSYDNKNYEIIEDATNKFFDKYSFLNEEVKSHVGIVLDELLNNLISYEEREDLKIDLDFEYQNNELRIIIISNGIDFNPFNHSRDESISSEDHIGGHGINIVKHFTKKQSYEYKNNNSVITIVF